MLEALRSLGVGVEAGPFEVVSDSTYVVNCFRDQWWVGWQRNGWRTRGDTPVLNEDLWQTILALEAIHRVTWVWVRGHTDNDLHNRVDALAVEARIAYAASLAASS